MKSKRSISDDIDGFSKLINILEKNLRYVGSLGVDDATINVYRKVLDHLKNKSHQEILDIVDGKNIGKKLEKFVDPDLSDEQIFELTDSQIKEKVDFQKTSRKLLEKIAILRFGVTRSAISSLRSREALVEKIHTVIGHEITHRAISGAAQAESAEELVKVVEVIDRNSKIPSNSKDDSNLLRNSAKLSKALDVNNSISSRENPEENALNDKTSRDDNNSN